MLQPLSSGGIVMAEFKPGDTVRLKSGSLRMTVKVKQPNGDYFCEWLDEKGNLQGQAFAASSLVADDGGPVIA
jgi:uncharacterized protein YodC (DUF2158 family)